MDNNCAYFDGYSVRVVGADITVARRTQYAVPGRRGGERSKISQFSLASRSRMLRQLKECEFSFKPKSFITLTYPAEFPTDGRQVKAHFKRLLDRLQRKFPRIQVFWFLEFQERGAPHFHAYFSRYLPRGYLPRLWAWATNDAGGFVDIRKIIGSGIGYALKSARRYSAKNEQKTVPVEFQSVGRFWGWRNRPQPVAASFSLDWRDDPLEQCPVLVSVMEVLKNNGYLRFYSEEVPYCSAYWRFNFMHEHVKGFYRFLLEKMSVFFGFKIDANCLC